MDEPVREGLGEGGAAGAAGGRGSVGEGGAAGAAGGRGSVGEGGAAGAGGQGSPAAAESGWSAPAATAHQPETATTKEGNRSFLAELPVLVLIAFLLAVLLKTFLVQAFYIPSSSMEPTLHIGDRVLVNKVVYDVREPRRGEIVVFSEHDGATGQSNESLLRRGLEWFASGVGLMPTGERDFIKRIIGLPGETVEMRDGVVYIDGQAVPEATVRQGGYLAARDLHDFGPVTVPAGHYFMMGDNRPNSADSRFSLGAIPEQDIVGRAFVVIWPPSRLDALRGAGYGQPSAAAGTPPLALPAAGWSRDYHLRQ